MSGQHGTAEDSEALGHDLDTSIHTKRCWFMTLITMVHTRVKGDIFVFSGVHKRANSCGKPTALVTIQNVFHGWDININHPQIRVVYRLR